MANEQFYSCFPVRYCINLARRPDRWKSVTAQFARHGIDVARHEALDSQLTEPPETWRFSRGAYACALSHSEAILAARDAGAPAVFIFEDDVELHPDFSMLMGRFLEEIPSDWDGVWLGAIHRSEPLRVSDNCSRLVESDSTFAYGLRASVFDEFLRLNSLLQAPVDLVTKELQSRYNFYCTVPPLAWVSPGYSDIQKNHVNYWWLREGLTVDGTRCQTMLDESGAVLMPSSRGRVSPDVARFVILRYCKTFPEVIVVGYEPDGDEWPDNCRFESSKETALGRLGRRRFALISEIDLYIRPWDVKASLLKCDDHEIVCPSEGALELTPLETRAMIAGGHRNTDISSRTSMGDPCFLVGRIAALTSMNRTKVFHCPVQALRLSQNI